MSEQMAEPTSGESGSLSAGPVVPHSSDAPTGSMAAAKPESAQESAQVDSPKLVPEQGGTGETPKVELPKADAVKADAPKVDAPKADALRTPGKVMIMSSSFRAWEGKDTGTEKDSEPNSPMFGKRRLSAMAAVVALATVTGALGGALVTVGLTHFAGDNATTSGDQTLEASVARIDADILALKASVEHTSRLGMSQFNKTSDRLDRVEKAQIEPAAKLAKLSEAVDKLRAAPAAAAVPVAAAPAATKEVTGSIAPAATASITPAKPEMARLPTVEGWVIRDVGRGGALIQGRYGIYEVYPGDAVPGLGQIDAVRKQDGRWVVVTTKGLIVAH